jgi:hypothetical protein
MTVSHAVFSPSTQLSGGQPHTILTGTICQVKVPPQRFDALEALIRPLPAGLVSCRPRPWGFALQGRIPSAESYILADAATLLWLAEASTAGFCSLLT